MTGRELTVAGALVLVALAGCHNVDVQSPRLYGVKVEARSPAGEMGPVVGELLAVSEDSIWVLPDGALPVVESLPMEGLQVRPMEGGRLRPHLWATIGGATTGTGLMIACMSYEADLGCVLIVPAMLGAYHLLGLGARLATVVDQPDPMDTSPENLRRFARFPMGLPPGFSEYPRPEDDPGAR